MKKIILVLCCAFLFGMSCFSQKNGKFVPLFNGKDLSNWTLEKPDGFQVDNGELLTKSFGKGHDLYTNKKYGNFIMRFEFKLSKVGNSGVFVHCETFNQGAGYEVQLLAPWTPWRDDLHCTGSLYGHVAIQNRPDETTGIWHSMEIRCDRNLVTITTDGKLTTVASIDTVKSLAKKPYVGVIGLQANHANEKGQDARFRNMVIRDLDAEPDYVMKGFYEKSDRLRTQAEEAAANLGAPMVKPLAEAMAGSDIAAKSSAKQALFDLVSKATAPGASKKDKKEVASSLKGSVKSTKEEVTKNYLKWLLGMASK